MDDSSLINKKKLQCVNFMSSIYFLLVYPY